MQTTGKYSRIMVVRHVSGAVEVRTPDHNVQPNNFDVFTSSGEIYEH